MAKKKSDGRCNTVLQPTSTRTSSRKQVKKPQVRINGAKGRKYVQIKGVSVTRDAWVTVGPATPRNLGFAARMAEDEITTDLEDQIMNIGKEHGVLKDKADLDEYRLGNPRKQILGGGWIENADIDAADEQFDKVKEDMMKRETKAWQNSRKRDEKAVRKMMSKLKVEKRVFVQQKGMSKEDAENVAAKLGKKITGETNGPEGKYWILE